MNLSDVISSEDHISGLYAVVSPPSVDNREVFLEFAGQVFLPVCWASLLHNWISPMQHTVLLPSQGRNGTRQEPPSIPYLLISAPTFLDLCDGAIPWFFRYLLHQSIYNTQYPVFGAIRKFIKEICAEIVDFQSSFPALEGCLRIQAQVMKLEYTPAIIRLLNKFKPD